MPRLFGGDTGQAVVELALVMSVLTMIAIASTSFANGVSDYMRVVNAANAAAQYGSSGSSESTNTTQIVSVAKSDLGNLYPTTGGSITSSTADDGSGEGQTEVSVTVSVPYSINIPFASVFTSSLTLTSTAVMRVNPYGS